MSRFRFSVVGALVAVALLAPVAATAGVKVDVCHRSSDGSFQLINISENAFTAHVDHGDAAPGEPVPGQDGFVFDDTCTPIEDGPQFAVFARATSTDTDGGVHVIMEWVDTNNDGVPSPGDTIYLGEFPTAIPPGPNDYVTPSVPELTAVGDFFGRIGFNATSIIDSGADIWILSGYGLADGVSFHLSGVGGPATGFSDVVIPDTGSIDRIRIDGVDIATNGGPGYDVDNDWFDVEITL